jgi:hypothetical protein
MFKYFGIAEETLYRILIGEAVATEDLHSVVSMLVSGFATKELGD